MVDHHTEGGRRMAKLHKLKTWIILLLTFCATVLYAAAIKEAAQAKAADITLPLIFNGLAPISVLGFFGFVGKRYMDHIKAGHKELIDAKNDHAERIKEAEIHIEDCPNCPGKKK